MKRNKTSLLIGVTGFIGQNLANYLGAHGEKVIGTYVHKPGARDFDRKIRLVYCDVTKPKNLEQVIRKFHADYIYYLAAQSSVRHAWLNPIETIEINFLGGVHLLEILRKLKSRAKVLIFSSGTTYGASHAPGKSLNEEACLKPKDPYSVSKMGIDFFSSLYAHNYGQLISVVRLANLTGPGQSTVFSISNFASQIALMEVDKHSSVLEVGNLSTMRDYLDIRDGIRAIHLAMKRGKSGEAYNIASGTSRTLRDVLYELINLSKLERSDFSIKMKGSLIPKDEVSAIRLDPSKFKRLTGWQPRIHFRKTLEDILNEWRRKIRSKN